MTNGHRTTCGNYNIAHDGQTKARPYGHFLIGHEGAFSCRSRDEWIKESVFDFRGNSITVISELNLSSSPRPFAETDKDTARTVSPLNGLYRVCGEVQ